MCPASKTKVFLGSEIGGAAARDGSRDADLDTAIIYRKQLVANCTCNGKDAFGLAPFDLSSDPTLRPGDIVATRAGMLAYSGRTANGDAYTPVNPSTVTAELNSITSRGQAAKRSEPEADEDPGMIAIRQSPPPPSISEPMRAAGSPDNHTS
jgi:Protein of unknown function (DUF2865)